MFNQKYIIYTYLLPLLLIFSNGLSKDLLLWLLMTLLFFLLIAGIFDFVGREDLFLVVEPLLSLTSTIDIDLFWIVGNLNISEYFFCLPYSELLLYIKNKL